MNDIDEPLNLAGCGLMLLSGAIMIAAFVGTYYLLMWLA